MKSNKYMLILAIIILTIANSVFALAPTKMNYQGLLTDNTGEPVADANYNITFTIYYDATSTGFAATVWTETQNVNTANGLFSVILGSINPILDSVFNGSIRYLGIKLNSDPEMTPRTLMVTVPYAFNSIHSDFSNVSINSDTSQHSILSEYSDSANVSLTSMHSIISDTALYVANSADDDWAFNGSNIYRLSGNVGIGLTNPSTLLDVNGVITASGGNSNMWNGALQRSSNLSDLTNSSSARSNLGLGALSTLNTINGNYWSGTDLSVSNGGTGRSSHSSGYLVKGNATNPLSASIMYDGGDRIGIGTSSPDSKLAVTSTNSTGASIRTTNSGSNALWAYSSTAKGISCGTGSSSSSAFQAISYNNNSNYIAIECAGRLYSTSYIEAWSYLSGRNAITGTSTQNYSGIAGIATGSGNGVFGQAGSGYAGYFSGKVAVTGTLSKGGGSFKIDHPLDPENKYLFHSFVESPDMMNVYNGNIELDIQGEALVILPEYFNALNKEFRYQLTCIGGYAPVYIAETISDNKFRIAGGIVGLTVSWQVTGVRKDAFANDNRIEVEVDKTPIDQGRYLHPEAFGKDKTDGIGYNMNKNINVEESSSIH